MCFVLDINSFHLLFNSDDKSEFAPLRDWLFDHPRTAMVIGGTKYKSELDRAAKYWKNLAELERGGKLRKISDCVVDSEAERVAAMVSSRDFDDQHIVGLFCASGCRLFASADGRADRFIKDKDLYPKGQKPPKIYRTARHHNSLLCDSNIVPLRNLEGTPSD